MKARNIALQFFTPQPRFDGAEFNNLYHLLEQELSYLREFERDENLRVKNYPLVRNLIYMMEALDNLQYGESLSSSHKLALQDFRLILMHLVESNEGFMTRALTREIIEECVDMRISQEDEIDDEKIIQIRQQIREQAAISIDYASTAIEAIHMIGQNLELLCRELRITAKQPIRERA